VKAAKGGNESVRLASIKALSGMAGAREFPVLVEVLTAARSAAEIEALEKTLADLCQRHGEPVAGAITIHKAVYGDLPDGKSADVTAKVAALVKGGTLTVDATNATFGDPAQGIQKKLRVDFTVAGVKKTQTVGENQSITFAAATPRKEFLDALRAALPRASAASKPALERLLGP
jgi:hypothetical protein